MSLARRPAAVAIVASSVMFLAACSGSSGKQSAATTTAPPRTTAVSPAPLVADLGPCPKGGPASRPRGAPNAPGLRNALVPIVVLQVRVCRYDATAPSTIVRPPYAMQLTADTNRLRKIDNAAALDCAPTQPPYYFVTFANDTQHVDVWEDGGCGFVTNGVLTAAATTRWRNVMRNYTTPRAGQIPNPRPG